MPPLSNHRHEKFAQAFAQGKNATEAHQEAGYKPNRSTPCQLKQDPRISTRVTELQE
jgi:phage terminase small subunit